MSSSSSSTSTSTSSDTHKIILAHKPRDGQTISKSISDIGLNLLKTQPSELNLIVHTTKPTQSYSLYLRNLTYYVIATARHEKVDMLFNSNTTEGFGLLPPPTDPSSLLPFPLPPLIIDMKKALATELEEKLGTDSYTKSVDKKGAVYVFHSPTFSLLKAIKDLKVDYNRTTRAPVNTVNMESMVSYIECLQTITVLLHTHHYPTQQMRKESYMTVTASIHRKDLNRYITQTKRKAGSELTKETIDEKDESEVTPPATPLDQMTLGTPASTAVPNPMASPASVQAVTASNLDHEKVEVVITPEQIARIIPAAKPSSPDIILYGVVENAPQHPGVFIPYIPQVAEEDTTFVLQFFHKYLYRILGTNLSSASDKLRQLRGHWGIIGKSDCGKMMTHLYTCMEIALSTECQCYPLISATGNFVYDGCVILGYNFAVGLEGQVFKPLAYNQLLEVVNTSTGHLSTLINIYNIANSEEMKKLCPTPKSMRELSRALLQVKMSDGQRNHIMKLAPYLRFSSVYWVANADTIIDCLQHFVNDTEPEDEQPMHYTALFSTDKGLKTLAVFGATAPSFNIPGSPQVKIVSGAKNCPNPFYYNMINLQHARESWVKMISDKYILNQTKSQGARSRFRVFQDTAKKEKVWDLLNQLANKTYYEDRIGTGRGTQSSESKVEESPFY